MSDISDAAQDVLDAFRSRHTGPGCLGSALRTAALYCKRDRLILLSMADELDPPAPKPTEIWQRISDSCNLSRLEINEILGLIADEVEKRGDKQLDLDPGETSDWLRQQASKALDA